MSALSNNDIVTCGVNMASLSYVCSVVWAEAYLCTKWHLDPSSRLATTGMDRKLGGGLYGGDGSPPNTVSP